MQCETQNTNAYDEKCSDNALTELDHVKTAFVSDGDHEFLALLRSMLETVEDALIEAIEPKQYERLQLIYHNALRMQKIANMQFHSSERRKHWETMRCESKQELALELADVQELQRISSSLIEEDNVEALYGEILDAACFIMRSETASIQKLIPDRNELLLLAHKGFIAESAAHWKWVRLDDASSCAMAMSSDKRIIISDIETCDLLSGTKDLIAYRKSNIRATQSTRLVSRTGRLVGMISTHWSKVHEPSERELHLFDMIARQTADLIERRTAEDALRASEVRFRALGLANSSMLYQMNADWSQMLSFKGKGSIEDTEKPMDNWLDVYIPFEEQKHVIEAIQAAIRAKSVLELEHRIILSNGNEGWVFSCAVPVLNSKNQIIEWFGAATDITERKRIEEKLKEADRRKDEFLAMLSHELRNPLAAISNSMFVLSNVNPDSKAARHAQVTISRQVKKITRLVDDLLDITRITQNKIQLQLQQIDINEIVHRAIEDHQATFEYLGIALNKKLMSTPVLVNADPVRIAQTVSNLLQNASKFSSRGGVTQITVESDKENAEAVIRVLDSGVGIEPSLIPTLFEPFTQADRTLARSKGGLGLGLSLVKGLIELHGGTVNAKSAGIEQGAEFIIKLPLAEFIPNNIYNISKVELQETKQQISQIVLIIEDNISAAESLQEVIQILGHKVYISHDGYHGIKKAREIMPNAVLCDIGLPEINGYEIAKIFKADEKLRSICLIALTGYAGAEDIERARAAGFDHHLAKPPNLNTLEQLLKIKRG